LYLSSSSIIVHHSFEFQANAAVSKDAIASLQPLSYQILEHACETTVSMKSCSFFGADQFVMDFDGSFGKVPGLRTRSGRGSL